jgi:hypothetical protein
VHRRPYFVVGTGEDAVDAIESGLNEHDIDNINLVRYHSYDRPATSSNSWSPSYGVGDACANRFLRAKHYASGCTVAARAGPSPTLIPDNAAGPGSVLVSTPTRNRCPR